MAEQRKLEERGRMFEDADKRNSLLKQRRQVKKERGAMQGMASCGAIIIQRLAIAQLRQASERRLET